MPNILETIVSNESLKTLAKVIDAAGFGERLTGAGPFTFFAPNEEGFSKRNMDRLLGDGAKLKTTLEYHLVSERYAQEELDVVKVDLLVTECGKSLSVYFDENVVMIDNAHVVQGDIQCSNGVIHIIDNVFIPDHSGWYETTS